ncbi:M16 family metallopeptidase [Flexithrix dorotheae]|uniref:M16 family metallopeptidase n=1 Tax=Flexithrix dorotheae TaxID=70993 RepID=UPI0003770C59|nr:M16 family metallopeptidase [Flexithrix dorotheae]
MQRHFFKLILFFLSYFILFQVNAQKVSVPKIDIADLSKPIPVDPNVKIGKLKNGITYYLRKNAKPEEKIELRLVLNAGSLMENEDQRGLAHFMEHMCFNGTENFQKNELVEYLQSVGVKFGAHLNAYTSFDETVYILPIPSDKEEVVENGFQILEDWAHNVTLEPEEIDKERGVVIEEWRLRDLGPDARMQEKYFPILFKDSRYAERLPIGKVEVLENFKPETIKDFYNDWYRPDLMSVVVVGDMDLKDMEARVKKHFGKIKPVSNPKERKVYDVPDHKETLVAIVTDKEASNTQVQVIYKHDTEAQKTLADYKTGIVQSLYNGMLSMRLRELTQSANPPFIFGGSGYGGLIRTKDAYYAYAGTAEDGVEKGLQTLLEENKRVMLHGFTEGELSRYKMQMMASYEKAYNERDKTESGAYVGEYQRNFLENEPIPGIAFEFGFVKAILPSITLDEVNALAKKWITEENRVVVITAPEKEGVEIPSEERVLAILNEVDEKNIEPYVDNLASAALMENIPTPGKVTASVEKPHGVTELTLSNGAKVVLKPTDFKNDEILFDGFSFGGSSIYPDEVYQSASNASVLVSQGGIGEHSITDVQKLLTGKIAGVNPYIRQLTEGLSGRCSPKDLETMFQLAHLYFTAPRKDPEAFQGYMTRLKAYMQNLLSDPNYYYSNEVSKILSQNHPRGGGIPTMEELDAISLDKAFEVYQERFKDASDFTFFLVGNFDVETIKPLLETYLGSLPDIERDETWKDVGMRYPEGVVKEEVKKGADAKSQVTLAFTGDLEYSRKEAYKIRSITEILQIKLTEKLREEMGGVYGSRANGSAQQLPVENYSININFTCSPENVQALIDATFGEIKKLQEEGPLEKDLVKIKETQKLEMKEGLKENGTWLSLLRNHYIYGREYEDIMDYAKRIDAMTAEELKDTAKQYFNFDNYAQIVLYPETKEGGK